MTGTIPALDVDRAANRWLSALPDLVAFVAGCGVAWWRGWRTTDLVWSLWLSSLVVGYASIVWMIVRGRQHGSFAWTLFLLGFFTFHFGMFHLLHSAFLNIFFPVIGRRDDFPDIHTYVEVFRRYWVFLPSAFLSERAVFGRQPSTVVEGMGMDSINFIQPYKNVFRMHLLIFVFLAAYLFHIAGVVVFTIVYAAYFFPWRLWRKV